MKDLAQFVFEKLSDTEIMTMIETLKVDFSETASMSSNDKNSRLKKGKAQEQIFIDTFNSTVDKSTGCKAISVEAWCEKNGISYSPKVDSKNGDIVIQRRGKDVVFIDLKVSEDSKSAVGTPTILSLVNFSGAANHIYFLSNMNGSTTYVVDPDKLLKLITDKKGFLVMSKHRLDTKPSKDKGVTALAGNIKIRKPKTFGDEECWTEEFLYDEDFVATNSIANNYDSIKK